MEHHTKITGTIVQIGRTACRNRLCMLAYRILCASVLGVMLEFNAWAGDPSLVGYWRFDEGAGLTTSDASGYGNLGTLVNGPAWAAGQNGGALSFDGVNDYVDAGNGATLNPASQLSLVAWINPTQTAASGVIVAKDNSTTSQYYLRMQVGGKLRFGLGTSVVNGSTTLAVNTWTLVAATYDGAQMTLYVNGNVDGSLARTGAMSNNGINVRIGGRQFTTPLTFSGRMDEVRLYNRALSQAEIQAIINPPANTAPLVNAGQDQTITLPAGANLSGSASDDGLPAPPALTTSWSQFSGPGTTSFGNASVFNTTASFSAAGVYVLRLTASDGALSSFDDVQITVNAAPPVNQPPLVNAGADQTITMPATASLSGSANDDGLPAPPALTTSWSQFSGPGTTSFGDASALNTTASFSTAGVYVLRLTASDGALSSSDDVQITVNATPPSNQPPSVNAGADQTITFPSTAHLSGTANDDGLPMPPLLTTTWSKFSGPGIVTFSNVTTLNATATFSVTGVYVLRLTASDGALSSSDDVQITVSAPPPVNQPPLVNAGADQTIMLPATANLGGSASDDGLPAPPLLTTTWSKFSGPGTVTFGSANALNTTASFSGVGVYVLRLTASDGALSSFDDVQVTVNAGGVDSSLVSYWRLDENSGISAGDASGNSNTGTLLNGPLWATGQTGSAVSFDGVNDYISVTPKIATAVNSTVAAWFKTTSTLAEDIYSEGSSSSGTPLLRVVVNRSGAGTIGFEHRDNAVLLNSLQVPVSANNGAWHHVAVIRTAANAWKIYFDGALAGSLTGTTPGAITINRAAIGSLLRTTPSSYFKGQIDEVRLYNRALSQAEIQAIINPPSNAAPLVNAGLDQTITLPATASLSGSASDDGLPAPPALTTSWSQFSGPGTASFGNASALNTTASFSAAGVYVLRLTASDGALSSFDDVQVTVNPANVAPGADAGLDQTITLPAGANLSGSASDDGLPAPPALTFQWLKVSGPGTVSFADASATNTTASFSVAGTYDLQLKANDGEFLGSDDVSVTVLPVPNTPPSVTLTNPVEGSVFAPPASIDLGVDVSDTDGTVAQVDYFAGTVLIGTASSSPFALTWQSVGSGNYALTAVATDNGGATSTSSVVNVIVSNSPPPANDLFANAEGLSGSAGTVNGQNINASLESGEPFHAGNLGGASVWYTWTAGVSSQTLIDTLGSDFDTLLAVYVGDGVSLLDLVGSNNNIDLATPQSRLSFTSIAGTTYYFAVDGYNGAQGNIVLNWSQTGGPPPPLNDGFATAQPVTGTVGSLTSSTTGATKEPGEPNHAAMVGGASVWYQWTAPTDNMTTFDTLGSPFNTVLAVYTGDSVAALTEVASNDNYISSTFQSRVRFQAYAGTNYFIAVDGTNGASGTLVLSWNQEGLGNLPDLTVLAGSYFFTNQTFISTDCAVVEGMVQTGARRLMLFTIRTRNQGAIDWFIGNPTGNPSFVWAPCHAHYHYNNFMQYRLLDSNGQLAAPGFKVGFCISDSVRWDPTANTNPKYHCLMQGVQRGWEDIYASHTTGQWIDITGLPDGYYTFEATVNPMQLVQESNYNNNAYTFPVIIGTPPPPNNNFANAQALSGLTGTVTGLNNFGSKETGEPNHAGNAGGKSIWYTWTAVNGDGVIFDTKGSSFNTLLAAYTGTAVNSLTTITSNDDIGGVYGYLASRVTFTPTAGTTYYLAVDGYNNAVGTNKLNWIQTPPPFNDAFANAQLLTGGTGSVTGTNLLASKETSEPNHAGNAGGRSLWHIWTAPVTGTVTIDTIGSEFDTTLAVYTGSAYGALTTIASNDDIGGSAPTNVWSRVTFTANQGTTYRIALDGYGGKRGNSVLNWNQPAAGGSAAHARASHYELAVVRVPVELQLTCAAVSTGGILLRVQGSPRQTCTIQTSSDLVNWSELIELELDELGQSTLVDRAKIEGRPNLNDPWCGDARTGIYIPPRPSGQAFYYRASAQAPESFSQRQ